MGLPLFNNLAALAAGCELPKRGGHYLAGGVVDDLGNFPRSAVACSLDQGLVTDLGGRLAAAQSVLHGLVMMTTAGIAETNRISYWHCY